MPFYLTGDGKTFVADFGEGDILIRPMRRLDCPCPTTILFLHPIEPGEVGREVDAGTVSDLPPQAAIQFRSVEALDVMLEAMQLIREQMVSPVATPPS